MGDRKPWRRNLLASLIAKGTAATLGLGTFANLYGQQPCVPCDPDVAQYYNATPADPCPPAPMGVPMAPMPSSPELPTEMPSTSDQPLRFRELPQIPTPGDVTAPTIPQTPAADAAAGTGDPAPPSDAIAPAAPAAEAAPATSDFADTSDFDVSSALASNFGSGTASALALADTPNMIGDFFGSGGTLVRVPLPFEFQDVNPTLLGAGATPPLGFDVNNNATIDLTTFGSASTATGSVVYQISEPLAPTDAPLPGDFGFEDVAFIGGEATRAGVGPVASTDEFDLIYVYETTLLVPGASSAAIGRMKLAENVSPIPRDRVFVNYSFFDNVPFLDGISVNRFTPGFEKAFLDGMFSFEFRTPMAVTADSDLFQNNLNVNNIEFGDLFMSLKALLYQTDNVAVSAGLSWTAPTADDLTINSGTGPTNSTELIRVENGSVHLLPFIGGLYVSDKNFFQGFLQFDFDAGDSPVSFNLDPFNTSTASTFADDFSETSLMYIDLQAGRWLYRNRSCSAGNVTGLAILSELHINQTLEESNAIRSDSLLSNTLSNSSFQVGEDLDSVTVVNAIFGLTMEYQRNTTTTVAYGTPIGNSADQQFDGEVRVLINRFF
ncbi:MAG: hypothetical protein AAF539_13950 [Planctomycetota bacterium]